MSLIDATAERCLSQGFTTVGLLGTAYTMEAPFYADGLRAHGLEVHTPDAEDRAEVHRVVYEELVRGVVAEQSRQPFVAADRRLAAQGCEAVLLACTEFGLLEPRRAHRRPAGRHDRGARRRLLAAAANARNRGAVTCGGRVCGTPQSRQRSSGGGDLTWWGIALFVLFLALVAFDDNMAAAWQHAEHAQPRHQW